MTRSLCAILSAFCLSAIPAWQHVSTPTALAEQPDAKFRPQAVEKSMHEFMEYLFQPTYKRLKQTMNTAQLDSTAWKAMKADSLILAEAGNLLILRTPKENAATWNRLSAEVRKSGGELYQAARKKDIESAKRHYESMLKCCNGCHQAFAGGKYQLLP